MIALWNYLHEYYVCSTLIRHIFLLLLANELLKLMATMIPLVVWVAFYWSSLIILDQCPRQVKEEKSLIDILVLPLENATISKVADELAVRVYLLPHLIIISENAKDLASEWILYDALVRWVIFYIVFNSIEELFNFIDGFSIGVFSCAL